MLSKAQWSMYKNLINSTQESFNQDLIVWNRYIGGNKRWGEDEPSTNQSTPIGLKCLIQYNIFRTWPMSKKTPSGVIDNESIVLILNKEYLDGLGYINSTGFFSMDPGKDSFTHRGLEYKASGETDVAQAGNEPLLFYVVLTRELSNTGTDKY